MLKTTDSVGGLTIVGIIKEAEVIVVIVIAGCVRSWSLIMCLNIISITLNVISSVLVLWSVAVVIAGVFVGGRIDVDVGVWRTICLLLVVGMVSVVVISFTTIVFVMRLVLEGMMPDIQLAELAYELCKLSAFIIESFSHARVALYKEFLKLMLPNIGKIVDTFELFERFKLKIIPEAFYKTFKVVIEFLNIFIVFIMEQMFDGIEVLNHFVCLLMVVLQSLLEVGNSLST